MPSPTSLPTTITPGATTGHVGHSQTIHAAINTLTTMPTNAYTVSRTAALSDSGEMVELNSASALTFTIPPNSAVAFPIGTILSVSRYGTGAVSVVAGAGVTIRTSSSLTLRAQYSDASIRKRATDEWVATGDLS